MEVSVWTYAFEPPGPPFNATTQEKLDWLEMSIPQVDLISYPLSHEVLGTIVYFTGPFTNTSTIYTNFKAYNNNTGELLFEMTIELPPQQWGFAYLKFWIGHASWEINGPMRVRMEINLSGWVSGSATRYMDVVDTSPPPPLPYYEEVESYTDPKPPDKIIIGWPDGYMALSASNDTITGWADVGEWSGKTIRVAYGSYKDYYHILYTNYLAIVDVGSPEPETPTPSIEEIIRWEATTTNSHTFYLFSCYGTDTNNTIEGFNISNYKYEAVTTESMSRSDIISIPNVSKFDCLTFIAELDQAGEISSIYDWEIKNNII